MRLLILGGTAFYGRALVDDAIARGHQVTLFNRGQTNPNIYPEAERLTGDRDGGLDSLKGKTWDAVIDTSGYVPRIVEQSAALLADAVGHYTFISSISVYADATQSGANESASVGTLADESIEEIDGDTYGPLKALCEQVVERHLPDRSLVIRPGLIVGPHDPTDRFTYWPCRIDRGGEVLAPGSAEKPVQLIDARDLAAWNLDMIEGKKVGTYDATGPAQILSIGEMLETCRQVSANDAELIWVDEDFLEKNEVGAWMELPLWLPDSANMPGFLTRNIDKALAAGLRFRPLAETVRDTISWASTRPVERDWGAGLNAKREDELLLAWKA